MALIWFGFGDFRTIFTIIITILPLTFASAMVGIMSVSVELEEVFDAYKLGILENSLPFCAALSATFNLRN